MEKVRVIKDYGNGGGTYANVEIHATEMSALRSWQQMVRDNLESFIFMNNPSKDKLNNRISELLLEAEKDENHEHEDPDSSANIHYDPQRMYYSCRDDDYSSNIEVLHLPINH